MEGLTEKRSTNTIESTESPDSRGDENTKIPLPNGHIHPSVDDNGYIKLKAEKKCNVINAKTDDVKRVVEGVQDLDINNIAAMDNGSNANKNINQEDGVQQVTLNNSHSECDMDSTSNELEYDLTTSSDGATDSVSTAISRVSISDTDSSSRTDSESKPLQPITYVVYESELQMKDIMRLITKDLSEPYSIYTYRYFIHNWPKLCFLAMDDSKCVGAIVCKLDLHKKMVRRGYIAMLAIDENYRRRGIGSHLVLKAIRAMVSDDCDEVVLETEITNKAALKLYENLGFVRDKRLFRYYLNGVDALRLKLWLR